MREIGHSAFVSKPLQSDALRTLMETRVKASVLYSGVISDNRQPFLTFLPFASFGVTKLLSVAYEF